jgi:hypothetical protein
MDDHVTAPSPDSTGTGFQAVEVGPLQTIGRYHHTDRFEYARTVSGNHFQVGFLDDLPVIKNLKPKNGTSIIGHAIKDLSEANEPRGMPAQRTVLAMDRVWHNPNYRPPDNESPYGYYIDHKVLGRRSKEIQNGVYLGGSAREAIVVDGDSEALEYAYDKLYARIIPDNPEQHLLRNTPAILNTVEEVVQSLMDYEPDRTEELSQAHAQDQLINLSTYVEAGVGVCRHQGLLAAYLLERLVLDGVLDGTVAIERNTIPDGGGTHAWATFAEGNELYVVDPAQGFTGTKAQARTQERWPYGLDTDVLYTP